VCALIQMGTFWALAVNCDLVTNKNSTVIKTAMCTVRKYYIAKVLFIVKYNLSIKLKNHLFSDILVYLYEYFVFI